MCVFMIGEIKVCRQIYLWTVEILFLSSTLKVSAIFGNTPEKEKASKRKDFESFYFLGGVLTGGFLEPVEYTTAFNLLPQKAIPVQTSL